jgi:PKD repeat protein
MMVAVGPKDAIQGGAIYVVTNGGNSAASPLYTFYESNDGGLTYTYKSAQNFANYVGTFNGSRNAVQNMRTRPYPFISVDNSTGPHRGRLYLVYASNFPSGNNNKPDIFCRYSDNGGTTWSAAKTVNDDANTVNNNNWFPAVWNDPKTGRLYVSWMDTRDCPTSDSCLIYASYTDDGVTFAPNQQISNKKMKINCTSCGGGGSPMYLGDYNGIAANEKTAILAWTDFRDNNFGSYVGYFPDYGLRAEPQLDTVSPYATIYAKVPSVKLFSDTVVVSATVNAAIGLFTITYPEGNKLWSFPGQVPIQISSNNAAVGDYTVTITTTGSNGTPVHKRTATIRVVASVPPVANFTSTNTNPCEGQPTSFTDLSTGPPSNWAWSFPGATPDTSNVQNPTGIVYNTAGTYNVSLSVTNQMGTSNVVLYDFITVKQTPVAPIAENQAVCLGQPVPDLTALGIDVTWYSGGSVVGSGTTYNTGQTAAGVYNYTVTQSANGCESLPTAVSLTINNLPEVFFSQPDTVCESATAFDLTGGTPAGGTYSGTGIDNGLTFDPAVAGAGNQTITYSYTDVNGCSNSAVQVITVNPKPMVTMDAVTPVCVSAGPVKLSGTPAGGYFTGAGVSGDTLYPTQAGVGLIDVMYTYNDTITGCPATATQTVTINALPDIAIIDSTICGNLKLFYDVTISNPQTYLWSPGGATTPILQIDTIGKGLGTHIYSVTVTDANGCSAIDSALITFYDCTGINELPGSNLIELYPNPSTGQFAIRSQSIPSGKYDLSVFDSRGKMVYSELSLNIENEFLHSLNLSALPNGIYVLNLKNKTTGYSKRFIINK